MDFINPWISPLIMIGVLCIIAMLSGHVWRHGVGSSLAGVWHEACTLGGVQMEWSFIYNSFDIDYIWYTYIDTYIYTYTSLIGLWDSIILHGYGTDHARTRLRRLAAAGGMHPPLRFVPGHPARMRWTSYFIITRTRLPNNKTRWPTVTAHKNRVILIDGVSKLF